MKSASRRPLEDGALINHIKSAWTAGRLLIWQNPYLTAVHTGIEVR